MNLLIVTGLSGAGKSLAMHALEDIGFFCIDNIPANLLAKLMEFAQQSENTLERVAVVLDIRGGKSSEDILNALGQLKAGDSAEIGHYLATLRRLHPQRPLYAAGVSLGGNALAKYLGETGDAALCDAAAVISAPVDLPAASVALERGLSRRLYAPYFLHTLLPKVRAEAAQYPPFDLNAVLKSRSLGDFDNAFTAPVHGFADKNDYYRRAAAKPLLRHIRKPTLLLNAQNDPFMPAAALPRISDVSEQVYLHQPPQGGHVGFVSGSGRGHLRWLPETLLAFFEFETHPS